jgi:hypothetical protein
MKSSLLRRIQQIKDRRRDDAFLVVYDEDMTMYEAADGTTRTCTTEQVEAWQQQHPRGTVIRVEYSDNANTQQQ